MKKSQFFATVVGASALLLSSCTLGGKKSSTTVKSVSLDKSAISIKVGEKEKLTVTVEATKESYKAVTWSSDKTSVATVDQEGYVTAVAEGTAVITVVSQKKATKKATCSVTVTKNEGGDVKVTGISLNPTSLSFVIGGVDQTITPTITPSDATNKNVNWSSSNTSVATVSGGVVHAVAAGSAVITATTVDGGKTATCPVTVSSTVVPVTGVTLDKQTLSMTVGDADATLVPTVSPSDATNKNVSWSSSDPLVATVSNGKVHAVKEGTATITVKTDDGNKTATCVVSVAKAVKTTWSEAEKALFASEIYGVEPPFHGVEGCDEAAKVGEQQIEIYGGTSSKAVLDAYAAKFGSEWGLENYHDIYLSYLEYFMSEYELDEETAAYYLEYLYGITDSYYFMGERSVSTSEGTRYVSISFAGIDSEGYITADGSGTFDIFLSEPYLYSWNDIKGYDSEGNEYSVDEICSTFAGEEIAIPAFETSRYYLSDIDGENGVLDIYCFDYTEAQLISYADQLLLAGWEYNGQDEDGYEVYLHPTAPFAVTYVEEESYLDLYLCYMERPITEWPGEEIMTYVHSVREGAPDIPAFTDAAKYTIEDYTMYGYPYYVYCFGTAEEPITEEPMLAYLDKCAQDGFVVEGPIADEATGNSYYSLSPATEEWIIYVYCEEEYESGEMAVTFEIHPLLEKLTEYPAEVINAFYEGVSVGTLPAVAISSADGYFTVDKSYEANGILILNAYQASAEDASAYAAALVAAGWVAGEADSYGYVPYTLASAPEAKIEVGPLETSEDESMTVFSVWFDLVASDWSADEKAAFEEYLGVVPPFIPEFAGELNYYAEDGDFWGYASGDLVSNIGSALLDANWVYDGTGEGYYGGTAYYFYYDLGGGTLAVSCLEYVSNQDATVWDLYPYQESAEWSDELKAEFAEKLDGEVPPYVEGFASTMEWDDEYESFGGYTTSSSVQDVKDALLAAGYVSDGTDEDGDEWFVKETANGVVETVAYDDEGYTCWQIGFSGAVPPEPGKYGTEENPLSCGEALVTMAGDVTADGEFTAQVMYVEGTIVSMEPYSTQYGNYTNVIIESESGEQVKIYRLYAEESSLKVGYWIEVCGFGSMYKGEYQMSGDSSHQNTQLIDFVPGEPPVVEGITVDFSKTTNPDISSYSDTWTATDPDGHNLIVRNGNNNKNGWTFVKFGGKTSNLVGSIETSWAVESCASVVVNVTGVIASYPTVAYVFVSDTAFTAIPTDYSQAVGSATIKVGDNKIVLDQEYTNKYVQVVFVSETGGSSNGKVSVQSVTYCPTK